MTAPRPTDAEAIAAAAVAGSTALGVQLAALQQRIAIALDVPPQLFGLPGPPPPAPLTRRERAARHVGQAGWRLGHTVAQAGRLLEVAGDRIIDAGDWLAAKVAGR